MSIDQLMEQILLIYTNGYAGGNVHVDQHYLFFHPTLENTFIVCNDGGIWKTTNNGDNLYKF